MENVVVIDAPLEEVWDYCMDISKIPEFHPRVTKVDMLTGQKYKEVGAEYQCNITEGPGKGTCVEKIEEVIPYESFTTTIPEDTMGLGEMFENYTIDSIYTKVDENTTRLTFKQYFQPRGVKGHLIVWFFKRKFSNHTLDTMNGIKDAVERQRAAPGSSRG
jgi:hypothetical protein